jgi:hypothetical protein
MGIYLVVTLCHLMSGMTFCGEEVRIPTEQMVAGKVTDPVPYDLSEFACKNSAFGMMTAQSWVTQFRPGYYIQKVQCIRPQNYVPKDHA